MKRVGVVVLLFVTAGVWAYPIVDGVISPTEDWIAIANDTYATGGGNGAHLNTFYYYPTDDTLYLAFSTQNTESWNVAYGIGFDPKDAFGYVGTPGTDKDAWNRYITFDNPPTVNWEFYWYWDGNSNSVTSFNACQWTGSGWNYYPDLGTYAYTGGSNGLQQMEYKVAWADLEVLTLPDSIRLTLWIAGADNNSSAVDVIPGDPTVTDGGGTEWSDTDDQLGAKTVAITPVFVSEGVNVGTPVKVTPVLNGLRVTADRSVAIEVYRADGRKVLERSVNGFLNLADLERGVYLYRVKGSYETGKVMVVH